MPYGTVFRSGLLLRASIPIPTVSPRRPWHWQKSSPLRAWAVRRKLPAPLSFCLALARPIFQVPVLGWWGRAKRAA